MFEMYLNILNFLEKGWVRDGFGEIFERMVIV